MATTPGELQESDRGKAGSARLSLTLLIAAIVLAAFNLRPAVTSVGPALGQIQQDLSMPATLAGLLTTVPVLAFAAMSIAVPVLIRRWGATVVLLSGMVLLTVGVVLRSLTPNSLLFLLATVVALAGVAMGNVVMPALIKHRFAHRVGAMTAAYTTSMAVGTSLGAALTVPVAHALGGWRQGLGVWALTAALAVAVLAPTVVLLRGTPAGAAGSTRRGAAGTTAGSAAGSAPPWASERAEPEEMEPEFTGPVTTEASGPPITVRNLTHSPLAWAMALFFGLQSANAYAMFGWLPSIYADAGFSDATAGLLVAFMAALAIPFSGPVASLAAKLRDVRPLIGGLLLCYVVGYVGLAVAPRGGAWLWAFLIGTGASIFPLALALVSLRARTHHGATALSGFAQSLGYLVAAIGPFVFGLLHEISGGWMLPLGFMVLILLALSLVGWIVGRHRFVEDDLTPAGQHPTV